MVSKEIEGLTCVEGRGALPRDPAVLVEAVDALLALAREESCTAERFAAWSRAGLGLERGRALGLVGLVSRTGVARIGVDGVIQVHPGVSLQDLVCRIGAWARTRLLGQEHRSSRDTWVLEIERLARAHRHALRRESTDAEAGRVWLRASPPSFQARPGERPLPPITLKLRRIIEALDAALVERPIQARAVLLALLAGQHALLLGPPGTAKSLLARSLCDVFQGASYFEYLLSRFTHPDELFGPVSIPGLKGEDYRRLTQGFLPRAHVAFLDEIFKANSAILNSLLTLVNERVFHHGRHRDPVPLLGLIGASNELPEEGAGLEALYDRFLVRLSVPPVAERDAFLRVATGEIVALQLADEDRLTLPEVEQVRAAARQVRVPERVRVALARLWEQAHKAGWQVSDRRWRQAVDLLRVAAASEGRQEIGMVDLLLLEPCLSGAPDRQGEVREALLGVLGPAKGSSPVLVEAGQGPHEELEIQWALLGVDRVAPTVEDPVPMGDPPSGWASRLSVRQASLARLRAHHQRALEALAAARARSTADHGDRLWLPELPAEVLLPYLQAARALATVLDKLESYAARVASPEALVREVAGHLPPEDRLRAEHLDAVITIGELCSIGLAYRQWRLLPRPVPAQTSTVVVEVEPWLDWLSGERADSSLLAGVDAKARRALSAGLPELKRALAPHLIPAPDPRRG